MKLIESNWISSVHGRKYDDVSKRNHRALPDFSIFHCLFYSWQKPRTWRFMRLVREFVPQILENLEVIPVPLGAIRKLRKHIGVLSWSGKCLLLLT